MSLARKARRQREQSDAKAARKTQRLKAVEQQQARLQAQEKEAARIAALSAEELEIERAKQIENARSMRSLAAMALGAAVIGAF